VLSICQQARNLSVYLIAQLFETVVVGLSPGWIERCVDQHVQLVASVLIIYYFLTNSKGSLQEGQRWVNLQDTNTYLSMIGDRPSVIFVVQSHLIIPARNLNYGVSDR